MGDISLKVQRNLIIFSIFYAFFVRRAFFSGPLSPNFRIGIDKNQHIASFFPSGLGEKGHIEDHCGRGSAAKGLKAFLDLGEYGRVNKGVDFFDVFAGLKDNLRQAGAVDGAVGGDLWTKRLDKPGDDFGARELLVGQAVGVDDLAAQLAEQTRDGRFSRADAAEDADNGFRFHAQTVSGRGPPVKAQVKRSRPGTGDRESDTRRR